MIEIDKVIAMLEQIRRIKDNPYHLEGFIEGSVGMLFLLKQLEESHEKK